MQLQSHNFLGKHSNLTKTRSFCREWGVREDKPIDPSLPLGSKHLASQIRYSPRVVPHYLPLHQMCVLGWDCGQKCCFFSNDTKPFDLQLQSSCTSHFLMQPWQKNRRMQLRGLRLPPCSSPVPR